jgi:hypothetical protein
MRGDSGACFRPDDADEVLAAEPMTGLDLTELRFLEPATDPADLGITADNH